MPDTIIIGSGPAGVSAALYIRRAGFDVTVISSGGGALLKTEKVENYYGFSQPVSGKVLYQNGIDAIKRIGVKVIGGEAVSLSYNKSFTVKTADNSFNADAVLLATGASRLAPPIDGVKEFEGKGVSYCAVCDGFFFRNKDVGVLGSGEYALNEVNELLKLVKSVTVFTNGEKTCVDFPENVQVVTEQISRLSGTKLLSGVILKNGEEIPISGLFVAYKTAGSSALAKKVGAAAEENKIIVDSLMHTSVKGLFAAGDCTGGLLQISKAVYEGAVAGTEIIKYLKKL